MPPHSPPSSRARARLRELALPARRPLALALLVLLAAYLLSASFRPLLLPDEFRYAEIPREMLAGSSWIVPRLDDLPYFEKPVLGYWILAASQELLGTSALALRLPCVLAAVACAACVARVGARAQRSLARAAAPVVLLSSGLVMACGGMLLLDSLFSAFVTLCVVALYAAGEEEARARRLGWLALAGASSALAFWTKGLLGLVLPASVGLPWLARGAASRRVLRELWIACAVWLCVAAPWSLAVARADPDFWRWFFWNEHVRRLAGPTAQHARPAWFYLPVLLGAALPWSFQLPAVVRGLRASVREEPLLRYALLWLALPLLLLSCVRGKLPTYVLPLFPALALLVAHGLARALEDGHRRLFDRGALLGALLVGLAACALAVAWVLELGPPLYGPEQGASVAALLGAGGAWVVLAVLAASARGAATKLALYSATPLGALVVFACALPAAVRERSAPGAFLAGEAARIPPDAPLVCDEKTVHPACWTLRRADAYLLGRKGELEYGLSRAEGDGRFLDGGGLRRLLDEQPEGRSVWLVLAHAREDVPVEVLHEVAREARYGRFTALELRRGLRPEAGAGAEAGTRSARALERGTRPATALFAGEDVASR